MLYSEESGRKQPQILALRTPPQTGSFTSGALAGIAAELKKRVTKVRILDLGACSKETTANLGTSRCVIAFEDLGADPMLALSMGDRTEWRLADALSTVPAPKPFDLVLAWDILNYLQPKEIVELFGLLASSISSTSFVHLLLCALVRYPARPGRFEYTSDSSVRYRMTHQEIIPCPRISPHELERLLPYFTIERLVLLQDGYYEVVLKLN